MSISNYTIRNGPHIVAMFLDAEHALTFARDHGYMIWVDGALYGMPVSAFKDPDALFEYRIQTEAKVVR